MRTKFTVLLVFFMMFCLVFANVEKEEKNQNNSSFSKELLEAETDFLLKSVSETQKIMEEASSLLSMDILDDIKFNNFNLDKEEELETATSVIDIRIIELLEKFSEDFQNTINYLELGEKEKAVKSINDLQDILSKLEIIITKEATDTKQEKKPGNSFIQFTGNGKRKSSSITDLFLLPKGIYKVVFKTDGYGIVYISSFNDYSESLFNVGREDAVEGAEALYKNPIDRELLLEFSNLTDPYEITFEKLH